MKFALFFYLSIYLKLLQNLFKILEDEMDILKRVFMKLYGGVFYISMMMWVAPLFSKILLFTYAYNRPDFIKIQHKTFKKFLEDDYEFIVFNDAPALEMENKINEICAHYGIRCVRIPQDIHDQPYLQRWPGENYNHPTVRNVNVVQYSLDILGFDHDDIVVLLDSDMFLVKKFSVRDFLKGYDLGGRLLGRGSRVACGDILYLWHGLAFLDMRALPNKRSLNFNCGRVENLPIDAGGHSYYYLKSHPTIRAQYINYYFSDELRCNACKQEQLFLCNHNYDDLKMIGFDEYQIQLMQSIHNNPQSGIEFFHNNTFLHYRCGSNWDNQTPGFHRQKTNALCRYIKAILS